MSLLQDVLRSTTADPQAIERRLHNVSLRPEHTDNKDDSDDELVNVVSICLLFSEFLVQIIFFQVSLPGTPARTRPSSPTRSGAAARPAPGPLHISSSRRDPLKVLPTELSQRIFARLSLRDLAKCSLVSKKWSRSQTLNYGGSNSCQRISSLSINQSIST